MLKDNVSNCRENEYVDANDTRCMTCPINTWPDNETRKFCVVIEPTYLEWTNPYGLTLSCLATLGIITSFAILVVVLLKRECKVIKVIIIIFIRTDRNSTDNISDNMVIVIGVKKILMQSGT